MGRKVHFPILVQHSARVANQFDILNVHRVELIIVECAVQGGHVCENNEISESYMLYVKYGLPGQFAITTFCCCLFFAVSNCLVFPLTGPNGQK